MKYYTIILVLATHLGFGQEYKISLAKTTMVLSSNKLNITNVIDGRSDKSNIGFVQTGMTNKKINAVFDNEIESEILNFIKRNTYLDVSTLPIELRIVYLNISEKTTFSSEKGFAKIGLDFLVKKDSSYFVLLSSESVIECKGMDVTKKHPDNIAKAFVDCFEQFSKIELNGLDYKNLKVLSRNNLAVRAENFELSDYPKLLEKPKKGIYKTYIEFLNNDPSILEFDIEIEQRTVEGWTHTFSPILTFPNKRKKVKNVWGFSNGATRNIYHQIDFFEVIISEEGIYFEGYSEIDNSNLMGAAIIGGAIGAGIASSTNVSKAKKTKSTYEIDLNKGGTIILKE